MFCTGRVMQWYVSQGGRTWGPISEQRLAMLVHWGKISRDAYICDEQWTTWIALKRSAFAPLFAARAEALAPTRGLGARLRELVASGLIARLLGVVALLVGALVTALGIR